VIPLLLGVTPSVVVPVSVGREAPQWDGRWCTCIGTVVSEAELLVRHLSISRKRWWLSHFAGKFRFVAVRVPAVLPLAGVDLAGWPIEHGKIMFGAVAAPITVMDLHQRGESCRSASWAWICSSRPIRSAASSARASRITSSMLPIMASTVRR